MDIVAHTLWVGAGVVLARRRWPIPPRTAALTLLLAALPDILHMLPLVGWWLFGEGTLPALRAAAIAEPGREPVLPQGVRQASWHLHCVMHSAVVAGAVTLVVALRARRRLAWIPLLGWWSHIAIDVLTHSAAYYPAPVLYPFTQRGFDGLAWITPWFLALNYGVLAAVGLGLWLTRRGPPRRTVQPRAVGSGSEKARSMTSWSVGTVHNGVCRVRDARGDHVGNLKWIRGVWKFKALGHDGAGAVIPGGGPLTDRHNTVFASLDVAQINRVLGSAIEGPASPPGRVDLDE